MLATDVTISLDVELKDKAQPIFDALGIDISTAVNMLLRKMIYQDETIFDAVVSIGSEDNIYLLKPDPTKMPLVGCMKDSMEIPPDFDEPLDEMKGYMY